MTHEEEICARCHDHGNCPYEIRNLQRKCQEFDRLDMADAAKKLVEAVEQYVEPKPGTPYMHRSSLLEIKNRLKEFV